MFRNFKPAKLISDYQAYVLVILIFILGFQTENFYTTFNFTSIFNSTMLIAMMGAGFTICLIAGQLDLSVGAIANTAGVVVMGMHTLQGFSWTQAFIAAIIVGTLIGIINGFLVGKAKIHSFITTLGMSFVLRGLMFIYIRWAGGDAEIGTGGKFEFTSFLRSRVVPDMIGSWEVPAVFTMFTWQVFIALVCVIVLAVLLTKTRWGRNIYMVGGNPETAWLAGIKRDFSIISTFAVSGFFCAVGGAMFAVVLGSAQPLLGEAGIPPLMVALTATIIGGTSVAGGIGSVWKTYVAVFGLMAMFNVLTPLVGRFEIVILANGLVLAACVLYETIRVYFANKKIGIRTTLVEEHIRESEKKKK